MKGYLIKAPEGMLEKWKNTAFMRKMTTSQMVREAVNKDIEEFEASLRRGKDFDPSCRGASEHELGTKCKWCAGSK